MQYEPLDIEAIPYNENKSKKKKKNQQNMNNEFNPSLQDNQTQQNSNPNIQSSSNTTLLNQQNKHQPVQQLVYINTLSFQAMEVEITFSEYLSIFFGCGVAIYLFTKLMPILSIEDCGEIGYRIIGMISLFYFIIPPLCLCSTGFKNNKRLCNFVSQLFFGVSIINIIACLYVFSKSVRVSKNQWYLLKASCTMSDDESEIEFKTTQIILCQIFLSINGFILFILMRNLAKLIEIRDCAVRKKMVILPHKIINVNFPVFYDQIRSFLWKIQVDQIFNSCILFL